MDPRLWQQLNMSPGELFIRHISLSHKDSTLTLECEAVSNSAAKRRQFRLEFVNCRDIRWQSLDAHSDEMVKALGLYLGEESHRKPAVVYTGAVEMSVLYRSVRINE